MTDIGRIYKIKCGDCFYIGSTVSSLKRRATTHRFRANHSDEPAYASRLYKYLNGKEWSIEQISEHPAIGRKELLAIEAAAILAVISDPNCLNDRAPCRDKEKARACQRRWYASNRDTILAKQKEKRILSRQQAAAVVPENQL